MFIFKRIIFQRLTCSGSQNFIRCLSKDPGIGLRSKALKMVDEQDVELEDFEDLEADFMDVHKSHKEHMREMDVMKEKAKYHIVKHKYFREKFPNFLTWHDKEQIRYLHRSDPEEWTVDKLSEGFPALPEIIKKLIKSNWVKAKQHNIINHDKSVQKNWELFKNGQLSHLPTDLVEHLNKFTSRALNFNDFVPPVKTKKVVELKRNNRKSEFSEIITSYENLKKNSVPQLEDKYVIHEDPPRPPLQETPATSKSRSRGSLITLEQLQSKVHSKMEAGKPVSEEEKSLVINLKSEEKQINQVAEELNTVIDNKYQTSPVTQIYRKAEREVTHLNYPEKISIPKAIFKKGFIYKLNDCYYDDDGEFLYRVPGMG